MTLTIPSLVRLPLAAAALAAALPALAASAAPIDLDALRLVLGERVFEAPVTIDYVAAADLFQATDAGFEAVLDGNPLASNAILEIAPGFEVDLSATGPAFGADGLGTDPGLVEVLASVDVAVDGFAGTGPFVLAHVTADGLDLAGDITTLPGTLSVFEVAPIPLPAAAWLMGGALAGLLLARRRG